MRFLRRLLQRSLILALGIFSVWLIVFVVFEFADQRLPWILAFSVTCGIAAYNHSPACGPLGLKVPAAQKCADASSPCGTLVLSLGLVTDTFA